MVSILLLVGGSRSRFGVSGRRAGSSWSWPPFFGLRCSAHRNVGHLSDGQTVDGDHGTAPQLRSIRTKPQPLTVAFVPAAVVAHVLMQTIVGVAVGTDADQIVPVAVVYPSQK